MKNNTFKSKWGFILSCVGSAVGMANVWGFPYKLGSNGGAVFLIVYLIFVCLFGFVGLSAEYAMGRRSKTGTLGTYQKAWESRKLEKIGKIIGWIPLIGSLAIAIGYAIIISYVLKGLLASFSGELMNVDSRLWFESFAFKSYSVTIYHIIVIIVTLLTLVLGSSSIEKTNKIMMPLFFVLFVILAIRVATLDNVINGYKFLFVPNWNMFLNKNVWISAMGQAFFSLSITGSGMLVYGAYLSDKEDVVSVAKNTAIFDTIAALVAALVMIPACFAYGLDPSSGPSLLFVTLPKILQNMPAGQLFAIILFSAVIFGGITSLQNMFEVVIESITYKFKFAKRIPVIIVLGVVVFGSGINMHKISSWGPWMDYVSIYIIPIGAFLGAITWFYVSKKEDLLDEINKGAVRIRGNLWYLLGKYVYVPISLLLTLIAILTKTSF